MASRPLNTCIPPQDQALFQDVGNHYSTFSRVALPSLLQLEKAFRRLVAVEYCVWLPVRVSQFPNSNPLVNNNMPSDGTRSHGAGYLHSDSQGSNLTHKRESTDPFLLHNLPSTKEGWQDEASDQPEGVEQVRHNNPLQDGGNSVSEGFDASSRLDDPHQPQRRLLLSLNTSGSSAVSAIHLQQQDLTVHMPPQLSSKSIHEAPEASDGIPQEQGHSERSVHRRYSSHGTYGGHCVGTHGNDSRSARGAGLPDQLPQFTVNTCKEFGLLGLQGEFQGRVSELTGHEDLTHTDISLKPVAIGTGVCPTAGTANREALSSAPSHTTSATPLQEFTAAKTPGPSERRVRLSDTTFTRSKAGPRVVVRQFAQVEQELSEETIPKPQNRDRRISTRVGGVFRRYLHWRLLGRDGGGTPHQRTGDAGGLLWDQSLCPEKVQSPHSTPLRQHNSGSLCQPPRRNQV